MALHSMKNKSTGFSANMMMLEREVCQPIDLILGLTRSTPLDPPTWVANLLSNLSDIHNWPESGLARRETMTLGYLKGHTNLEM